MLFNETFLGQMSKYAIKIKPICFNSTIFNFQKEKEIWGEKERDRVWTQAIKSKWYGCLLVAKMSCLYLFRAKLYEPILRLTLQQYRLVRGDKSELIICPRVNSCESCEFRHRKKLLWRKKSSHDMWWAGIGRNGITILFFESQGTWITSWSIIPQ